MLVPVPTLYIIICRASQDIMIVFLIFWLKRLRLSLKAFNVAEGSTYFSVPSRLPISGIQITHWLLVAKNITSIFSLFRGPLSLPSSSIATKSMPFFCRMLSNLSLWQAWVAKVQESAVLLFLQKKHKGKNCHITYCVIIRPAENCLSG